MDQEMAAFFDERLRAFSKQIAEETTQQIADLREEMISRFERGEETARHTVVLVEDLRHKLELVAEGVVGTNEKLDQYRTETLRELDQVKGLFKPYYRELDGRVRNLDGLIGNLDGRIGNLDDHASLTDVRIESQDGRLKILENRAERQHGDVMNAIRKMLGKPPLPPPVTSE